MYSHQEMITPAGPCSVDYHAPGNHHHQEYYHLPSDQHSGYHYVRDEYHVPCLQDTYDARGHAVSSGDY